MQSIWHKTLSGYFVVVVKQNLIASFAHCTFTNVVMTFPFHAHGLIGLLPFLTFEIPCGVSVENFMEVQIDTGAQTIIRKDSRDSRDRTVMNTMGRHDGRSDPPPEVSISPPVIVGGWCMAAWQNCRHQIWT